MGDAMSCIQDLQEVSSQSQALLFLLETYDGKVNERERLIEEIHKLLDKREEAIQRLQQYSQAEIQRNAMLNSAILEMEPKITARLQKVFADIKISRKLIVSKMHSREKYRNPYASMPFDGAFLDKRK